MWSCSYVTFTFPSRVVLTGVYLGYGAIDVTPRGEPTDDYDTHGSFTATVRLCSPSNAERCPHYDNYRFRMEALQVHGTRRAGAHTLPAHFAPFSACTGLVSVT